MDRVGLTARYFVIVLVSSLAAGLLVSTLQASGLRDAARREALDQMDTVSVGAIQSFMFESEFLEGVNDQRRQLMDAALAVALDEQEDVLYTHVFGVDGELLVSNDRTARLDEQAVLAALTGERVWSIEGSAEAEVMRATFPVQYAGGQVVGAIQNVVDTSLVEQAVAADERRVLVFTGLAVAVVQLLALPLLVSTSRRLRTQNGELERQAQEYRVLATHDRLTGLPNRALLDDRLDQALLHAGRHETGLAVLALDLDGFKVVNDTLGHAAGDELLARLGPRLAAAVRGTDTVCRFGGDEFIVVLTDVVSREQVRAVAAKLRMVVQQPIEVDTAALTVDVSIGASMFPGDASTREELLRKADIAMYAAKQDGGGIAFYDGELDGGTTEQLTVLTDLRRAIDDRELTVHFQPIVAMDGRAVAHEALLRWDHPTLGPISPAVFVPAAERSGLIQELTALVLRDGLRNMLRAGLLDHDGYLSVNVSTRDLMGDDLQRVITRTLADLGLPGSALQIEVTETAAMRDPERAGEVLAAIRELGVHVVIDDYGTGHSSLAYLQQLPVRSLKIDRRFITHMTTRDSDRTIVRSTIELAHNLGLTAVAEGVEDEATMDALRLLGCDAAQGYLHGRPGPLPALARPVHDVAALV